MKTRLVTILEQAKIEILEKQLGPKLYQTSTFLFFEGQIPHVAYLLLEGQIQFKKRNKVVYEVRRGELIGVKELMHNLPCSYGAQIAAGTKVCILDRSTIQSILSRPQDGPVHNQIAPILSLLTSSMR